MAVNLSADPLRPAQEDQREPRAEYRKNHGVQSEPDPIGTDAAPIYSLSNDRVLAGKRLDAISGGVGHSSHARTAYPWSSVVKHGRLECGWHADFG